MAIVNALGASLPESAKSAKSFMGTMNIDNLVGTENNDVFRVAGSGGDTLAGGKGDDTYIVYHQNDQVIEKAGEGIDTIRAACKYILPDNVENLTLEGVNAWYGGGNSLDNIIKGNTSNQQFDGGKGNDVLTGGGGADIFIFSKGSGADLITDFSSNDKIRLNGYGVTSFAQVQKLAHQVGADTVLDLGGGDKIVLQGVKATTLDASNFQLGVDTSKMTLTFADEFNSLSLLDNGGTWRTKYKDGGSNPLKGRSLHDESEIYVDPAFAGTGKKALGLDPFSIKDGVLSITAKPVTDAAAPYLGDYSYTSGVLTSKFTFAQKYGYFEIRAALPEGQGFWPAFWLLPTDNTWPPEIDILEQLGRDADTVYQSRHTAATPDGKMDSSIVKTHIGDTSEFHTYGLNWDADNLIWYVDGVETRRIATPADMNKEMYILLNLAVGGNWAGAPDATTGTGDFKIDYVHVYQNPGAATTPTVPPAPASAPVVAPPADTPDATAKVTGSSVQAYVDFTLADGQTALSLVGDHAFNGTGNAANNRIIGNDLDNVLMGLDGNDTLIGGKGADTLIGGQGNDLYVVDSVKDVIVEKAGEGTDSVQSSVTWTLGANVEHLSLTGDAAINGTGNDLANRIIGNDAANVLKGLGGNDTLIGNGGNDVIDGGAGNDIITGGAGNDRLTGGTGKDSFNFDQGFGKDTITDFNVNEDRLNFTGPDKQSYVVSHTSSETTITFAGGDVLHLLGVNLSDTQLKGVMYF
jgi:serralysin